MKTPLFLLMAASFLITVAGASANMVGYYSFDTNGNADYGSHNFQNFSDAGITITSSGCKVGSCVDFSGTQSALTASLSNALIGGDTTYALSFWVVSDAPITDQFVFASGASGSSDERYQITATGRDLWLVNGLVVINASFDQTNYGHVALVSSGSTKTAYINGVAVNSSSTSAAFWNGLLYFGNNGVNTNQRLNGRIDELSIYNSNLSASQISCIYNTGSGSTFSQTMACVGNATTLTITAIDNYNSTALTNFNATVTFNGTTTNYTTTNGSISTGLTVNSSQPANITVTPTQTNYFAIPQTFTNYNTSTLQFNATPYTAIRAQSFTGTNISNFTAVFNSTNYPTTNGIAYIPLYNGTYEVQITNAQQGSTIYANSALNLTGNPYLQNQTFTLYTYNSIRIFVRSETTGSLLSGTNVTINTNGETTARTNTTSNGTLYIDNLPDGTYSIIFSATSYANKLYTVTVANYSSQELNAYLSNSSTTTTFNLEAANGPEAGQPIEGAIVTFETYINGSYVVVESRLSDVSGTAGPFTYTTSNPYRVTITADNFVTKQFLLNPVQYSTYDIFLTSTTSFTNAQDYEGISIVFTPSRYLNGQQTNFTFIISSPNGTLTAYNYTATYPGGTSTNNGVNAYGETLTSQFNITGATISSTVTINFCYNTAATNLRCFSRSYPVRGIFGNNTLSSVSASGVGELEKIGMSSFATALIVGMTSAATGPVGGGIVWIILMGTFYLVFDFSIWLLLIPAFIGFIVIAFGSSLR